MTRASVLWIGGAQWAGKTTVSLYLTVRYPLIRYFYDYHDARAHAERARAFFIPGVSDPERAQRNRVERDRLLAEEVVEQAGALGLPVIHVDGVGGEERIVSLVEEHFKPFLPKWIY